MHHSHFLPVMIPLERLRDGAYYAGICRNARVARWNATAKVFVHWREKFGRTFTEEIGYFTPGGQYDEFIPVIELPEHSVQYIPLE